MHCSGHQGGFGGLLSKLFLTSADSLKLSDLGLSSAILPQVQMVSSMRIGRNVNYRILDIDWCTSDKVVLASDDGCVRVLEMAMKSASYRMDEQDLTGETGHQKVEAPRDRTRDLFSKGFSAGLENF